MWYEIEEEILGVKGYNEDRARDRKMEGRPNQT